MNHDTTAPPDEMPDDAEPIPLESTFFKLENLTIRNPHSINALSIKGRVLTVHTHSEPISVNYAGDLDYATALLEQAVERREHYSQMQQSAVLSPEGFSEAQLSLINETVENILRRIAGVDDPEEDSDS